jgi:hypothetical protein
VRAISAAISTSRNSTRTHQSFDAPVQQRQQDARDQRREEAPIIVERATEEQQSAARQEALRREEVARASLRFQPLQGPAGQNRIMPMAEPGLPASYTLEGAAFARSAAAPASERERPEWREQLASFHASCSGASRALTEAARSFFGGDSDEARAHFARARGGLADGAGVIAPLLGSTLRAVTTWATATGRRLRAAFDAYRDA